MNEFYEAWERYYDDAIMSQSRKYTQAWKKAFADEAVRNCNTLIRGLGECEASQESTFKVPRGNQKQ